MITSRKAANERLDELRNRYVSMCPPVTGNPHNAGPNHNEYVQGMWRWMEEQDPELFAYYGSQ